MYLLFKRWAGGNPADVISTSGYGWKFNVFFQGSFEIISCTCLHSLRFALFPTVDPKKKFGCFVCMPCTSEVLVSVHKDLCNVEPQMHFLIFQIAICHASWRDFHSITRTNACVIICCWISRKAWNGDYLVNSLFLYKVMIQELGKYVINYNSMILFQLV